MSGRFAVCLHIAVQVVCCERDHYFASNDRILPLILYNK